MFYSFPYIDLVHILLDLYLLYFFSTNVGEGNGNPLLEWVTWRIPETGEPGGLLSMGSHRVGHD